jgi:hypothetical protein
MATASLPMYPFHEWRAAYEQLWDDVRSRCDGLPPLAPWGADPAALWRAPDLAVSQTCGWPLVTELADRVRVVGTFRYRTSTWSGDHYRAVVVARDGTNPDARSCAAVNGHDSLSGWVSLVWWAGGSWAGDIIETGAHLASLDAVRDGAADVAAIDAVTFAYAERRPELVDGLTVVGHGPRVPCLPVICPGDTSDERLAALRDAFIAAAEAADGVLLMDGFSPLDLDDYLPIRVLPAR